MPTLNKGDDGHYYIRGKDFHRPEQEEDDYWTWRVLDLDATIDTIRRAGYEVSPFQAWFDWGVERILWRNGYIATQGQIAERRAVFMDRVWNITTVGELADELNVKPQRILNEAGRRGVRLDGVDDKIPRNVASWIREYFDPVNRSH